MVVNKRELIHHESTVCEYRKVKCHNCVKIEKEVEGVNEKMEGMKEKMEGMKKQMDGLASKKDVDEVKGLIVQTV